MIMLTGMLAGTASTKPLCNTMLLSSVRESLGGEGTDMLFDDPLTTGIAVYVGGFILLTMFESFIAPSLGLPSTLPTEHNQLTREELAIPFVTPITCDNTLPLPPLETLRDKEHHRVGRRVIRQSIVTQYIQCRPDEFKKKKGKCELSEPWSQYYGEDIVIFKKKS